MIKKKRKRTRGRGGRRSEPDLNFFQKYGQNLSHSQRCLESFLSLPISQCSKRFQASMENEVDRMLHQACAKGDKVMMEWAIENGGNVNAKVDCLWMTERNCFSLNIPVFGRYSGTNDDHK
jgi:hypothetical protein